MASITRSPIYKAEYTLLNYSKYRLSGFNIGRNYPKTVSWKGSHSIQPTVNSAAMTDPENRLDLFGEFACDGAGMVKCATVLASHDPSQLIVLFMDLTIGLRNEAKVSNSIYDYLTFETRYNV